MTSVLPTGGLPIGRTGRTLLTLCGAVLLAGFGLARQIEPDPRGYGTHQRLGLPGCAFQMLYRRPCPGCGMTTSLVHFARGEWSAAMRANPAGVLLALSCLGLIPWCWWSAWRGRLWAVDEPWPVLAVLVGSWGAVGLLIWMLRWLA
uniref:DUF2752 domain-containing protein n=1 Tax=Schlesneria paludicola TaxID=360056 RepID=A0A7C4LMM7_9PLAN